MEPELVVELCVHRVRGAWLCMGPGLVLRVGLVCGWGQDWLCMGSGLGCGGRAGCTWGQGQYVRPCKHAWTLEPFIL